MATVFPSIYQAKATQSIDNGRVLKVLVPQVFGEEAIEVTHFLGPATIGMGWILFQGGNPEFPVWTTRVGPGGGPDYGDEITELQGDVGTLETDVNNLFVHQIGQDTEIDGLQATDVSLDGRVDTLEATDVTLDGRLDALEAENPALHHWNSAWGIQRILSPLIAQNGVVNGATAAWAAEGATPLSVVAGRRYRITARVRAFQGASFAIRQGLANTLPLFADSYFAPQTPWGVAFYSFLSVPSSTGTYNMVLDVVPTPGTISSIYCEDAWVEDVGPVTPATVAPPSTQPLAVAAGNAIGIWQRGVLKTGVGTSISCPSGVFTAVTEQMAVTLPAGRRFRFVLTLRATAGTNTPGTCFIFDNGTQWNVPGGRDFFFPGNFPQYHTEWLIDGDGATHTVDARLAPSGAAVTAYLENNGSWYVEDVGPNTSPALPIPETPPAWTLATLTNGWGNYGFGFAPAAYRKIGDEVTVRGLIAGGSIGSPCLVLPMGFRPTGGLIFAVDSNSSAHARIDVRTNGEVGVTSGSNLYTSLTGIRFSTT